MAQHLHIVLATATLASMAPTGIWAAANQSRATPSTLELVAGDGDFKFGSSRDKSKHVLQFAISPRLADGLAITPRPGDLLSGGHVFPGGNINVGRRLSTNRRMLKLVITLNPHGVKPGKYDGQLPIFAGGVVAKQIPLTATLSSRVGTEFSTFVLAFGAILLGASVGAILKWLTEKGIKLQELQRRFDRTMMHLKDVHLPTGLTRRLASIEMSLSALDVNDAELGLDQIVSKLDDFTEVGRFFSDQQAEIEQQQSALPPPGSRMPAGGLSRIWDYEGRRLAELIEASWPEPSKTTEARGKFASYVKVFSQFLGAFDQIKNDDRVWRAITDLRNDKTELAEELVAASGASPVDEPATIADGQAPTRESRRFSVTSIVARGSHGAPPKPVKQGGRFSFRWLSRWPVRNAGFVYGAILAISVSLVGMTLLYYPKDSFGGALDWLTLILWGFGVQLSGFTIVQLGGRALGTGPKIAP